MPLTDTGHTALRVARDGAIANVTLDNPPINTIDKALATDLIRVVRTATDDHDLRVIVLQRDSDSAVDRSVRALHGVQKHHRRLGAKNVRQVRDASELPGRRPRVVDRIRRAVAAGAQTCDGELDLEGMFDRLT